MECACADIESERGIQIANSQNISTTILGTAAAAIIVSFIDNLLLLNNFQFELFSHGLAIF